ncbi:MAG: hypothetical protein AAFX81_09190 [Pseudomonadota bacterium]
MGCARRTLLGVLGGALLAPMIGVAQEPRADALGRPAPPMVEPPDSPLRGDAGRAIGTDDDGVARASDGRAIGTVRRGPSGSGTVRGSDGSAIGSAPQGARLPGASRGSGIRR